MPFEQSRKGVYATKSVEGKLDFSLDWGTQWLNLGESILASYWTIEIIDGDTDPLVEVNSTIIDDITTIVLSGGTNGNTYTVRNRVVTQSLEEEREFRVVVEYRSI